MKNTNKLVADLIEKYELVQLREAVSRICDGTSAHVAFLGEFSSGKTSLINRLIGTRLPTDTVATTKNICIVQPSPEIQDGQFHYLSIDPEGNPVALQALKFDELARSSEEHVTLVVEAPPSDYLPEGTVIVDTPGEGSLSTESAITVAYLSQVDAAVFCIPATDGTFHRHALDFLASPILKRVHHRMIFAITMTDLLKNQDHVKAVKAQVVSTLKELAASGRFPSTDIESRVVAVSVKDEDATLRQGFLPTLQKTVLEHSDAMKEERRNLAFLKLSEQVKNLLNLKLEAMHLDVAEVRDRIQIIDNEAKEARRALDLIEKKFNDFRNLLPERIGNAFDANMGLILAAKGADDSEVAAGRLVEDIKVAIVNLAKAKLGSSDYSIDMSWAAKIGLLMPDLLARIERTAHYVADLAFVVISAGLAAAVPGGAAAAGGAARGAAAVAAKGVAGKAAKTAGTVAKVSKGAVIFGKVAQALATALDSLNPASYIADWTVPNLKEVVLNRYRSDLVAQSDSIADMIWEGYQSQVVLPAQQIVLEKKNMILRTMKELESQRLDYRQVKDELRADIESINRLEADV